MDLFSRGVHNNKTGIALSEEVLRFGNWPYTQLNIELIVKT